MTRVAFVQASLGVGGAERLVQSLIRALDHERIESFAVNLLEPGPIGEALAAEGRTVASRLARDRWDLGAGGRLAGVLERHGADVAYVADSALPLFWAGWVRRMGPRPRLVVGFHSTGKLSDPLQHWLAGACAFPVADRFVALAVSHEAYLCRRFGLDPRRFAVIGNGVDTARFHPAADRAAAKRAVGLSEGDLHVGIVAALRPEKNHELFLRVAGQVHDRSPRARFLVIGEGPERANIERLAAAPALDGAVRLLGARDDMPELVRALDVAVLCSRPVVETFPLTLVEALASGVPVVSTRVGSIADIVAEGESGYLVPPGDAAALATALERLLAEPARREAMGRCGRAHAERRFDERDMVAAYAGLFEEVGRR